MIAIFNEVVPDLSLTAAQAQRRAIERLSNSLPGFVKIVITSSFTEVYDIVSQTAIPFLLYTNFPSNRVHNYDRTGLFLLGSERSQYENRNIEDQYSISLEILRVLACLPKAKRICIVTGAYTDIVSDDEIRSCGPLGIIDVHRKKNLPGFDYFEPFDYLASHFVSCIQKFCSSTAGVESTVDAPGSSESSPLFFYNAGLQIHAPELNRTELKKDDGKLLSVMAPSVPDSRLIKLERKLFELRPIGHPTSDGVGFLVPRHRCQYCGNEMQAVFNTFYTREGSSSNASGAFCSSCGWWVFRAEQRLHLEFSPGVHIMHRQLRIGQMRHFSPPNLDAPIHAVCEALAKEPDLLRRIKPRRFEEIVQYTFSSFFDCQVELTKSTRDGGVDIVGFDSNKGKFLIEVKQRTKPDGKIGVGVIRALCGALIQNQANCGLVVTNAVYTKDARQSAKQITDHGWSIELHDIHDLCEWLDLVAKNGEESRHTNRIWLERLVTGFQAIHGDFSDNYDPSVSRFQEFTIRF